ncbi:S1 family peptidase [Enterovibrio norvegicus]|uniref:S1 family peptidase n=1 Tax=Enterovibrio norvegicus TaxID=188144 RepID=UPI0024B23ADB|nr:serine protease [Enterovibrio norvegicus]
MKISKWIAVFSAVVMGIISTASAAHASEQHSERAPRIVGGDYLTIDQAPWQVLVHASNVILSGYCGGAIIADNYVLTAAHCLTKFSAQELTVFAGNEVWLDGEPIEVSTMFIHEDYDDKSFFADIALLKLSGSLPSNAQSISLISASEQSELETEMGISMPNNFFVSGWGATSADGVSETILLKGVSMTGVSDSSCGWNYDSNYQFNSAFANSIICANNTQAAGACSGDSGGPLVWQNPSRVADSDEGKRLAGVVSFGYKYQCGSQFYEDGFTQVSTYLSWINAKMAEGNSVALGGGGGGGAAGWLSFIALGLFMMRRRLHLS